MKIVIGVLLLLLGIGGAALIVIGQSVAVGIGIFLGKIPLAGGALVFVYQCVVAAGAFLLLLCIPGGLAIAAVGAADTTR